MRTFDVRLPDGRRLAVAEWGDPAGKPVFVFVGGQGRATCHPDETLAQRAGLRLLTVDRPDNGESDPQPGRTLAGFCVDLAHVADEAGGATFGVIGVSHGGATAAALAVRLPERVRALALVSSLAPPEHFVPADAMLRRNRWMARSAPFLLHLFHAAAWGMVRLSPDWTVRQVINSLPDADRATFAANPALVTMLAEGMREDYGQGVRGPAREAQLGYLPWGVDPAAIRAPVTIWHGEQDTTSPPAIGRWWAAQLPGSRLHLIPEAGHMLAFTHWAAILEEVASLLTAPTTPPE